uniref:Uncharacterized protein n=1 Tax=Magallana gigas TaxID=29159 RepID=K1Q1Q6_MAGGI
MCGSTLRQCEFKYVLIMIPGELESSVKERTCHDGTLGNSPKGFGRSQSAVELSSLSQMQSTHQQGIPSLGDSCGTAGLSERESSLLSANLMSGSHSLESSLSRSCTFPHEPQPIPGDRLIVDLELEKLKQ